MTSEEFIIKRFCTLSDSERVLVSNLCERLYNRNVKNYFDRAYDSWVRGVVTPRKSTYLRILELVPQILNDDEKIDLVLLEVRERIDSIKNGNRYLFCNIRQSGNICRDFETIINYELSCSNTLRWFTTNVLAETQVRDYNNLANYLVCKYLMSAYEGVVKDIRKARNMANQSSGQVEAQYTVKLLCLTINLATYDHCLPSTLNIDLPVLPVLMERFDKKITPFILECQIEMSASRAVGESNRHVAYSDFTHIDRSGSRMSSGRGTDIETTHEGESGTIEFKIKHLNIGEVRREIESLKKKQMITIIVVLCLWVFFPLGIVATLIGGLIFFDLRGEIKSKEKEIDDYGQKKYI